MGSETSISWHKDSWSHAIDYAGPNSYLHVKYVLSCIPNQHIITAITGQLAMDQY